MYNVIYNIHPAFDHQKGHHLRQEQIEVVIIKPQSASDSNGWSQTKKQSKFTLDPWVSNKDKTCIKISNIYNQILQ